MFFQNKKKQTGNFQLKINKTVNVIRIKVFKLKSESINTWKNGVERALKKYVTDGTKASGQKCPVCGQETLVYQEGCLICTNCGASRCG